MKNDIILTPREQSVLSLALKDYEKKCRADGSFEGETLNAFNSFYVLLAKQ